MTEKLKLWGLAIWVMKWQFIAAITFLVSILGLGMSEWGTWPSLISLGALIWSSGYLARDDQQRRKNPYVTLGTFLIDAERNHQIKGHGYTIEHDEMFGGSVLAQAAAAYLWQEPELWPWGDETFKLHHPTDDPHADGLGRIRELAKTGALVAASIDWEVGQLNKLHHDAKSGNSQ